MNAQVTDRLDTPQIEYELGRKAWLGYSDFLRELVLSNGCKRICEIGGGANPALDIEFLEEHGIEYLILDISEEELSKAPEYYDKLIADVTRPIDTLPNDYDLVFSRMLAEHVRDPKVFHKNAFRLLRPGGLAFHFFPTLFAPPFVVNYLLPDRLTYWVLGFVQQGREKTGKNAKFPAYYAWCRGPIPSQLKKFESIGFRVKRYIGYFGHNGYYRKVPFYERIHLALCDWLQKNPSPWLTSFAYVVLQKPAED